MTDQPLSDLDINGEPPDLAGRICEALLLQQFVHAGVLVAPANVIHLNFSSKWHRLYFDSGIVFWRVSESAPEPWTDTEEEWQNPLYDLGSSAGVVGDRLDHYSMECILGGSSVQFFFKSGRQIVFKDIDDRTNYHVI